MMKRTSTATPADDESRPVLLEAVRAPSAPRGPLGPLLAVVIAGLALAAVFGLRVERQRTMAPAPIPAVAAPAATPEPDLARWTQIATSDKPGELRDFLARFPQSSQRERAEARLRDLDDRQWQAARDTLAVIRYLDDFPDGAHRAEARTLLDALHRS